MSPVVSVVLPTYERADLLPQALRSVLEQTFTDLELIVVDDGSTDGTADVVRSFDDPRIQYLPRPHGGIAAARNQGIVAARGRFVAFLDSDDVWLPERLAVGVPLLDASPHAAVVHGVEQFIDVHGRPLPQRSGGPLHFPDRPVASLLVGNTVPLSTALVRRSCLERAGPCNEELVARIDWDLWIRLAMHGDLIFIDRVLACLREHEGRTTSLRSPRFPDLIRSRVEVLDRFYRRPDVPPEAHDVRPLAYRNAHVEATVQWLARSRWSEALISLRAAMAVAPRPWAAPLRVAWIMAGVPARRLRRRVAVLSRPPITGAPPTGPPASGVWRRRRTALPQRPRRSRRRRGR